MIHVDLAPDMAVGLEAKVDMDPEAELPQGCRSEIVVTVEVRDTVEETLLYAIQAMRQTLTKLGFDEDEPFSFATDWFEDDVRPEVERVLESFGAGTWAYRFNDEGQIERVNK